MSEQTSRCVIGTKAHTATVGYLCEHHADRLAATLRDVEEQAALLNPVPSFQQRNGRPGGLPSQRTPARLDVIVHTDRRRGTGRSEDDVDATAAGDTLPILDVLGSWARLVREDRELTWPTAVTISGERDLLSRNLDWLARQPWIDECYADVVQLAGQLKAANGARPDRPVGRCYLPGDDEGGECAGRIWRIEQRALPWLELHDRCERIPVDVPDGPARCDRCGHVWDGAELHRLDLILEQQRREAARPATPDGRPMLTAEELVAQGIVSSVSNVRVTAHRKGVLSVRGHYDPDMFRHSDVAS